MEETCTFVSFIKQIKQKEAHPKSLPRQLPFEEIHEYVTQRFHVIASRLLMAGMCIYAGVTRGSRQILIIPESNVKFRTGIPRGV